MNRNRISCKSCPQSAIIISTDLRDEVVLVQEGPNIPGLSSLGGSKIDTIPTLRSLAEKGHKMREKNSTKMRGVGLKREEWKYGSRLVCERERYGIDKKTNRGE